MDDYLILVLFVIQISTVLLFWRYTYYTDKKIGLNSKYADYLRDELQGILELNSNARDILSEKIDITHTYAKMIESKLDNAIKNTEESK